MTILALEHYRPPTDDRILIESILCDRGDVALTNKDNKDNK